MSAQWQSASQKRPPQLQTMTLQRLDAVLHVEQLAYVFPWSRGNFIDSMAAGYVAQVLVDEWQQLLGYFVLMPGVDEMHLLNITVAPAFQGQGHARTLLNAMVAQCQKVSAKQLWLEVRRSNAHAQAVYLRYGFSMVGVRKAYYPAPLGQREDALVMSLSVMGATP